MRTMQKYRVYVENPEKLAVQIFESVWEYLDKEGFYGEERTRLLVEMLEERWGHQVNLAALHYYTNSSRIDMVI